MTHSPIPWKVYSVQSGWALKDDNDLLIGYLQGWPDDKNGEAEGNAKLLPKAVNNYERMKELLLKITRDDLDVHVRNEDGMSPVSCHHLYLQITSLLKELEDEQ